jgi:flavorubredoxin
LAFSHFEADECGALNEFLAAAPNALPVCGKIAAMTSVADTANRAPRVLADGERLLLGRHEVTWFDTPHLPHGWESGLLMDSYTRTLFCGDLFTQGGRGDVALTEQDILGPSEAFRAPMDYYSHAPDTSEQLNRLAALEPTTLACMHGSAWQGDGALALRELAKALKVN